MFNSEKDKRNSKIHQLLQALQEFEKVVTLSSNLSTLLGAKSTTEYIDVEKVKEGLINIIKELFDNYSGRDLDSVKYVKGVSKHRESRGSDLCWGHCSVGVSDILATKIESVLAQYEEDYPDRYNKIQLPIGNNGYMHEIYWIEP